MWIEQKAGGSVGPARIGRVTCSKSGVSLSYRGQTFQSRKGQGFKANYVDAESGKEYWVEIRGRPDLRHVRDFCAPGKY